MRAFTLVTLFAALLGTAAFAGDPYPFMRSDFKWGFVNDEHCWVIEPQFDGAYNFVEGLAMVTIGNKHGFIDKNGRMVIRPQFDLRGGDFADGLASIWVGGRYGFIDRTGSVVINPQFELVSDFSEGLAMVWIGEKRGFINKIGEMAINPQFGVANDFSEGLSGVLIGDKYGFIDQTGVTIISPQYDIAGDFSEGLAYVQNFTDKEVAFIDKTGAVSILLEGVWDVGNFSEGLASARVDVKRGFLDRRGVVVIDPKFEYTNSFSEELAAVRVDGKWGFIDKTGQIVIKPQFEDVPMFSPYVDSYKFSNGRAKVFVNGEIPYTIDRSGHVLLDPTCDLVP